MAPYYNCFRAGWLAKKKVYVDIKLYHRRAKVLIGVELTFDVLYTQVARDWHQRDDLVTPYNDRRWTHVKAVWTFELDRDILRLDQKDRSLWIPLSLLRERSVKIADFKPCEPLPTLAIHTLQSVYRAPSWEFQRKNIDQQRLHRRRAFMSRILADFAHQ